MILFWLCLLRCSAFYHCKLILSYFAVFVRENLTESNLIKFKHEMHIKTNSDCKICHSCIFNFQPSTAQHSHTVQSR